jgi:pimeloyl-[acyl-carrier protein] methyl ester esterase
MHFTIQGQGPALLFIHGWAMHGGVWDGMCDEFSAGFQTIAVDLRGHGKAREMAGPYTYDACARDIIDLMEHLAIKRIAAVGWSMGVSILLKVCQMRPDLCERLVFMSGNPSLISRDGYPCGIPEITVRRLAKQVERRYPEGLRNFYDLLLTKKEVEIFSADPGYRAMTDPAGAPEKDAALATLACLMQEDLRGALPAIAAPTLILHGDEDAICNPRAAAFMNDTIPGARLVMLGQTGHVPFLTRRKDVAGHLRLFLESSHDGNR